MKKKSSKYTPTPYEAADVVVVGQACDTPVLCSDCMADRQRKSIGTITSSGCALFDMRIVLFNLRIVTWLEQ